MLPAEVGWLTLCTEEAEQQPPGPGLVAHLARLKHRTEVLRSSLDGHRTVAPVMVGARKLNAHRPQSVGRPES